MNIEQVRTYALSLYGVTEDQASATTSSISDWKAKSLSVYGWEAKDKVWKTLSQDSL